MGISDINESLYYTVWLNVFSEPGGAFVLVAAINHELFDKDSFKPILTLQFSSKAFQQMGDWVHFDHHLFQLLKASCSFFI